MMLLILALGAAPPAPPAPAPPPDRCLTLLKAEPAAVEPAARQWEKEGGGAAARQCLALAYANQQRWNEAAPTFEAAARMAPAGDDRAASYWAQAGNAWLAAGDGAKAAAALDAALADPNLAGLSRGEAELDRARAAVATGDRPAARAALDRALPLAGDDPLAWLLSATLARQMGDLPRAKLDIAQALTRSADDASVQLEAGNIAALGGDAAAAKVFWTEAARLKPDSPQAKAAEAALAQFD